MALYSPVTFVRALVNWDFLKPCFKGTKIAVSDIDGQVEVNGFFLILETKAPYRDIPTGQKILFDRYPKDRFTVLVIWGQNTSVPSCCACGMPRGIGTFEAMEMQPWGEPKRACTTDDVVKFVSSWFERHSGVKWPVGSAA